MMLGGVPFKVPPPPVFVGTHNRLIKRCAYRLHLFTQSIVWYTGGLLYPLAHQGTQVWKHEKGG